MSDHDQMDELSTKEIFSRLRAMELQTKEIHTAVVGAPELGHEGLVSTVREHNKRITSLENWRIWAIGGAATVAALLQVYEAFKK